MEAGDLAQTIMLMQVGVALILKLKIMQILVADGDQQPHLMLMKMLDGVILILITMLLQLKVQDGAMPILIIMPQQMKMQDGVVKLTIKLLHKQLKLNNQVGVVRKLKMSKKLLPTMNNKDGVMLQLQLKLITHKFRIKILIIIKLNLDGVETLKILLQLL